MKPKNKATSKAQSRNLEKRKKRQFKIFLVIISLSIIFVSIAFTSVIEISENKKAELLEGTWVYDEYTKYEFAKNEKGCLYLENVQFQYVYKVKTNKIVIDFIDDSVRDCIYKYSFRGDALVLEGKEGTVGGTYKLHKQ